jgi:RHS repeat-associated protein
MRLNYTGQRLDDTGLLYYVARYYDPSLGRFVSPDSIVPGVESGKGGAASSVGAYQNHKLTVDFHEPGFITSMQEEHKLTLKKGFWFQLEDEDRKDVNDPWGPQNPQSLNRFAYVLNNPLKYIDPTGHFWATVYQESPSSKVPTRIVFTLSNSELSEYIGILKGISNPASLAGPSIGSYLADKVNEWAKKAGLRSLKPGMAGLMGALLGAILPWKLDQYINWLENVQKKGGTVTFDYSLLGLLDKGGLEDVPGALFSETGNIPVSASYNVPRDNDHRITYMCRRGLGPNYAPCR